MIASGDSATSRGGGLINASVARLPNLVLATLIIRVDGDLATVYQTKNAADQYFRKEPRVLLYLNHFRHLAHYWRRTVNQAQLLKYPLPKRTLFWFENHLAPPSLTLAKIIRFCNHLLKNVDEIFINLALVKVVKVFTVIVEVLG